jgi:hypothetical protein
MRALCAQGVPKATVVVSRALVLATRTLFLKSLARPGRRLFLHVTWLHSIPSADRARGRSWKIFDWPLRPLGQDYARGHNTWRRTLQNYSRAIPFIWSEPTAWDMKSAPIGLMPLREWSPARGAQNRARTDVNIHRRPLRGRENGK